MNKEHFSYKVYQEPKQDQEQLKERLISVYKRIAKNKKLQAELTLWDSISGDGLNDK